MLFAEAPELSIGISKGDIVDEGAVVEALANDSLAAASELAISAAPSAVLDSTASSVLLGGVSRNRRPISASWIQQLVKRAIDIAVSATLILMLLPLIVLVAVAILLDSGGPILFRSYRIGRNGRLFAMLKFRKMRGNLLGLPLTAVSDPRFTRIGNWLMATKLDEVPQLWNVLRGDMSLVGPRPEQPSFVAERSPDYETILTAKQGITGLSQLAFFAEARILDPLDPLTHYREAIWPQKIALDCLYVENATIAWDLRILFWSVLGCVVRRPIAVNRRTGALTLRRR